ncbi:MAG: DUF2974 domain-containing protein, partial [Clostridiales bacterium]|nr:DUF2974 domain-containing protein [Clostridiales bacterium]
MAALSYIDLPAETQVFAQCAKSVPPDDPDDHFRGECRQLLQQIAKSSRFGALTVRDAVSILNDEIQFAAMTVDLPDGTHIIAFRGTDGSLTGWREDFAMSFESPVPAQAAALKAEYPDALCALQYKKDYELMIAVRLSAQCTDERVNLVTPALFARYPTLESLAQADISEVEGYVRSCGFYHNKARDIVLSCQMLLERFGGRVPGTMEELLTLPGVGRKTANLLLGDLYKAPGAVVCDTHCIRITN